MKLNVEQARSNFGCNEQNVRRMTENERHAMRKIPSDDTAGAKHFAVAELWVLGVSSGE